ncbi:MAG: hypothetical protein GC171_00685 [Terrimonas sp.]|nr:hypothetical protein [Terrimonas sp.]
MIRDVYLRLIFIPFLGIFIPVFSGLITYSRYSWPELIGANLFFIFISLCIWRGAQWTHMKTRLLFYRGWNPLPKIVSISALTSIYGMCAGGLLGVIWISISREVFTWQSMYKFLFITALAVIVFTLVYEILFLTKEREVDNNIVDQLDQERVFAELESLRNELDPHFIFNSLNTLNHLILKNPEQAFLFNARLAQVYKYFLITRNKQVVLLRDEIEFMKNYFFLLQIRHDDKLKMDIELAEDDSQLLIPPCALQILVENAIKHNAFTENDPLRLRVFRNGHFIKISNNVRQIKHVINSTGIGLKNLSARYRMLFKRDIKIENSKDIFTVNLPIISNENL